jgi:RNA polymerase sigma-70 factor (sigma-E family)
VAIDGALDGKLAGAPGVGGSNAPAARDELIVLLFHRNQVRLCRLATLLVSDPARAEEIVQEAFLRTFSGWSRLRDPAQADAYLRRAVVNLCRSRLRRRQVERTGNEAAWRRDRRASAEVLDEEGIVVMDAVRSLPPRQREAVVLHYFAGLSGAEVADAMGCAEGTVKSQLAKARVALARVLGTEEERLA